ncbi:MAG: glycosyltransferase family 2 protein [Clostridiales bacterium]|nr:glycosyltransferase family 2 protein [Clostridiales bacterium]
MLFSIIVPVYKVEKYLKCCIESILTQSQSDFEVILVDDGSPDNSPQICDEYAEKDKRVKVVHKQNGGLVSARKAGLKASSGEYIVNIDGDDYIKQGYLEEFATAIEKHNADIVCLSYIEDADGKIKNSLEFDGLEGYYDREKLEREIFPFLLKRIDGKSFPSTICMKAFRKSIFEPIQMSVDDDIVMGEDYACVKPCVFKASSIYISNKCLYGYRFNPRSITKNKKAFDLYGVEKRINVIKKHVNIDEFDFKAQSYRLITHSLFNAVCSQFNRDEKYSVIKGDILKALKLPMYDEAVKNCITTNKKLKLAKFLLKHKLMFLIKIISRVR